MANSNTLQAGLDVKARVSSKTIQWLSLISTGIASIGLIPTYGISWAIVSIIAAISFGTALLSYAALSFFNMMHDLKQKIGTAAEKVATSSDRFNDRLDQLLELKQEILKTNDRIYDLFDSMNEIFSMVKGKIESLDEVHQGLLLTLKHAQDAIALISDKVAGLTEETGLQLRQSLLGVNEVLTQLQLDYSALAQRATEGVENVDEDFTEFKERLEDTLDKLDSALDKVGKAAQGGSDLLSPIRALGDMVRGIRNRFYGTPGAPAESARREDSSSEEMIWEGQYALGLYHSYGRSHQNSFGSSTESDNDDQEEYSHRALMMRTL